MPASTTPCCVVSLSQQQHTNICHHNQLANQSADEASVEPNKTKPKYCTVVENGLVVVKPVAAD